ncbi:STAS domain-containing protein [Actinokineospora bangkokensis]|uniref:STAS domain-containing protein n=1 Tax=Actinokineospora bangkokensis TaxID=1193682 RepID=A0A1Q9LLQ9_9PSEU|nr:STAS domain-containing protein [Actinokineospora bangkokensis]OLR92977.1 hypothetical protein BJP25_18615 [Actinokineospora bangkokensis]
MSDGQERVGHAVDVVAQGRAVVVALTGDVDMNTADDAKAALDEAAAAAERAGADVLVVDLRQVGFLASVGVSALLMTSAAGKLRGVDVVLCLDPDQPVRRNLQVAGVLGSSLPAVASVDEALERTPLNPA